MRKKNAAGGAKTRGRNGFHAAVCCVLLPIAAGAAWPAGDPIDAGKPIMLENPWLAASIPPDTAGALHSLNAQGLPVLWSPRSASPSQGLFPAFRLLFYNNHPASSSETLPLPSAMRLANRVENASGAVLELVGSGTSPLKVSRAYKIGPEEALLSIRTEIENQSGEPLELFPALDVWYNMEFGESGLPLTTLFLYAPYGEGPDGAPGVRMTGGDPEDKQFQQIPDKNIFIANYQFRTGSAAVHSNRPWLAILENSKRLAAGLEWRFPGAEPEPVADNLLIRAAGRAPGDKRPGAVIDKYIHCSRALGKIRLEPGGRWSVETLWSSSSTVGPIVGVENGAAISYPLGVLEHSLGFYLYAAMGVPRNGPLGLEYYNREGEAFLKKYNTMLCMDIDNQKPLSRAQINRPVVVSGVDGTSSVLEKEGTGKTWLEWLRDETAKIRLVLLDENRKRAVRVLGESTGPWQKYEE